MSAREGREAWDWARKHHANDHTGDPRPHRAGCGCGNCPSAIGPFAELGPNDEEPDGLELVGDETECSLGEECIGWNGRIANLLGEHLRACDADRGPDEYVAWGSVWLHPLAPSRPICEECADEIARALTPEIDLCALCIIGGPVHQHVYVAEQAAPVDIVLIDPEETP